MIVSNTGLNLICRFIQLCRVDYCHFDCWEEGRRNTNER